MYRQGYPQQGPTPRPVAPPPPQGNGFGQGLRQFIDAYRGELDSKKQNAQQQFDKHLQMLEAGIPVDKKQMAKWAKEAGLKFDYEAPPPPPPQAAQAPQMGPGGMSQGAANYGMQQAVGGAMPQPPPPPMPQQQQPGMMNRLGAAMGVPQPPSQAEQMGVMQMLNDVQKRGQMSKQMQGMQSGIQQKLMQALTTVSEGLSAGKSLEDPDMAQAIGFFRMMGGMQQGGKMPDGIEQLLDNQQANKLFPGLMKGMKEAAAKEKKETAKLDFRKGIATKMDPEQAVKAESWVFGETDEAPDFTTVDSEKLNKSVATFTSEYPSAKPEQVREAALLMFSKDADPADLSKAIKDLGESVSQTRLAISKQSNELAQKSGQRADTQLGLSLKDRAEEQEVSMAVGSILQLSGGDPDIAYDNAMNLAYAAFGGDRKKATQYLPEVKKALKSLSKNPDYLEKLMKLSAETGAKAALAQEER